MFHKLQKQQRVLKILSGTIRNNRVAHTYLFVGETSSPTKEIALFFAALLNCENPEFQDNRLHPCLSCENCLRIHAGSFVDIHVINADEKNKAVKIEDIRSLQSQANLRPYFGRKKVFVVCRAEYLTEAAANALLKILEEPPPDTILILTAENINGILPTVVSRCQVLKLDYQKLPQNSILTDEVIDKFEIRNSWSDVWKMVDYCSKYERAELEILLEQLIWWYRDVLVYKIVPPEEIFGYNGKADKMSRYSQSIEPYACVRIIEAVLTARENLLANVNIKLALADLGEQIRELRVLSKNHG
ncbi:MAG: hypothetical protein ABH952_04185 [Candidatus Omnitrophota bacterium]